MVCVFLVGFYVSRVFSGGGWWVGVVSAFACALWGVTGSCGPKFTCFVVPGFRALTGFVLNGSRFRAEGINPKP